MFVLLNLVGQLACCGLVLARVRVGLACGILFGVIAIQVCMLYIIIIVSHQLMQLDAMLSDSHHKAFPASYALKSLAWIFYRLTRLPDWAK